MALVLRTVSAYKKLTCRQLKKRRSIVRVFSLCALNKKKPFTEWKAWPMIQELFSYYPCRHLETKSELCFSHYHCWVTAIAILFHFWGLTLHFSKCGIFTFKKRWLEKDLSYWPEIFRLAGSHLVSWWVKEFIIKCLEKKVIVRNVFQFWLHNFRWVSWLHILKFCQILHSSQ